VQGTKQKPGGNVLGKSVGPLKDLVDHIDYLVKLIGIDHVGSSGRTSTAAKSGHQTYGEVMYG
jgi:hypothetical protein